jgi:hypothetical protein
MIDDVFSGDKINNEIFSNACSVFHPPESYDKNVQKEKRMQRFYDHGVLIIKTSNHEKIHPSYRHCCTDSGSDLYFLQKRSRLWKSTATATTTSIRRLHTPCKSNSRAMLARQYTLAAQCIQRGNVPTAYHDGTGSAKSSGRIPE